MDAAPGVGLAAPQVGVPLRVFTYSYTDDDGAPWRGVVINPVLWIAPLAKVPNFVLSGKRWGKAQTARRLA